MKIESNQLLQSIASDTRKILLHAERLKSETPSALSKKASPEKWSAAQVLQHLNFYSRHYLKEIESKITTHKSLPTEIFSSGWLGQYFTHLISLDNMGDLRRKMKSPKNATPTDQPLPMSELEEFIEHQLHFLELLQDLEKVNLNTNRVPTSLYSFIQLKIGDTIRFFNEHQKRHMWQIERALT